MGFPTGGGDGGAGGRPCAHSGGFQGFGKRADFFCGLCADGVYRHGEMEIFVSGSCGRCGCGSDCLPDVFPCAGARAGVERSF